MVSSRFCSKPPQDSRLLRDITTSSAATGSLHRRSHLQFSSYPPSRISYGKINPELQLLLHCNGLALFRVEAKLRSLLMVISQIIAIQVLWASGYFHINPRLCKLQRRPQFSPLTSDCDNLTQAKVLNLQDWCLHS